MMKLLRIIGEITTEVLYSISYFVVSNLVTFANLLIVILPYLTYFLGQTMALERNEIAFGGEIFIPVVFLIMIYYMKSTANKLGKGTKVPVPDERFTEVDEYGEVSIENRRIQELILYLADLEDWMERKGML